MPRFHLSARLVAGVSLVMLATPLAASHANAQTSPIQGTSLETSADIPRTRDGHPDFQGVVWTATSNFFAPLESSPMTPKELVLPEEEASKAFAKIMTMFMSPAVKKMIEEIDPEAAELMKNMKGFPLVRGERHTRLLVLPADGKLPLTPEARKDVPVGLSIPVGKADNPEDRAPSERCLAMPPPTAVVFDIPIAFVQTPDHIVISGEYSSDARIIPFSGNSGGASAHWDGDTLVIETTGFLMRDRVRPLFGGAFIVNPEAKVIERFARAGPDELVYQFTVEDPKAYSAPWLAEYSYFRAPYRMYASSCHEANYSLSNILQGQRAADMRKAGGLPAVH